jgi:hypothetical protein
MSEDNVWAFGFHKSAKSLVVYPVNDGIAIDLSRVNRPCLENLAGFICLFHAHGAGIFVAFRAWITAVEVEQNDFVPQLCAARDCASATVLRIAWVPAGNNDLELALLTGCPSRLRLIVFALDSDGKG